MEFLDKALAWVPFIILAALGGAANNTYQNVIRKQPFNGGMFIIAMGLAGFLGLAVAATPLPGWLTSYRESLACMIGFCVFPIMHVVETEFPSLLRRVFRRFYPESQSPNDPEN